MIKNFEDLLGHTLSDCVVGSDTVVFTLLNGDKYQLYHDQSCCENVNVEDVVGDVIDLIGSPITLAEESSNSREDPLDVTKEWSRDSFTWTFYRLATVKGYVTIRFYGESNGYYSESVSFEKMV